MKMAFIGENRLDGIEADAAFAAEHGFQGLEFDYWANFADLTGDTVARMREILDRHGAVCSALGLWGWNHIAPDPAERETSLAHLDRAIGFAATLGASVLITGGGDMAMYPVHGNSFFQGIADYQRVWERGLDVGIKLDPANWLHHGTDPLPVLRDHGDRVTYVHIKEHMYMDGGLASQPAAGMGDVPWGKLRARLHRLPQHRAPRPQVEPPAPSRDHAPAHPAPHRPVSGVRAGWMGG